MNMNQGKPFDQLKLFLSKNLTHFFKLDKGIDCYIFKTISSTNETVWDLIDNNTSLPLVVIARQQTAGKGQRGHKWISKKGGLYLSLGLEINLPINHAHHLTLFTVYGIVNNLRKNNIPIQIKWLNDLFLKGKKLGGILTETRSKKNLIYQAVIGVGINWQNEVPEMAINLESLREKNTNFPINSLEELSLIVLEGIFSGYEYYITEGINPLIKSYEQLLYNLGEQISLEIGEGIITGINEKGELKIKLKSQGASAEIFLPASI